MIGWVCERIHLITALMRMFLTRAVSLLVGNTEADVVVAVDNAHKLEHNLDEKADRGGSIIGNNNSIDPSQKTNFLQLCAT